MDNSIHFTIPGRPVPKKNNPQAYCIHGRRGWARGMPMPKKIIIPSKAYLEYEKLAVASLRNQFWGHQMLTTPLLVVSLYYLPDKRWWPDLYGLLQATGDILQKAGIIENDSLVKRVGESEIVGVDKENPRCEITITPWLG